MYIYIYMCVFCRYSIQHLHVMHRQTIINIVLFEDVFTCKACSPTKRYEKKKFDEFLSWPLVSPRVKGGGWAPQNTPNIFFKKQTSPKH